MKRVLAIIVSFNGRNWLEHCLSSVAGEADLFVWDNASRDGSADFVASAFPQAKLIRSDENLGFALPNNKGFEYAVQAGYEYVYLLNQDAWLEAGALGKLLSAADAHPEFGLLSPMQMQRGCKLPDVQFGKILCGAGEGGELVEVRRLMAAHWLVSAAALKRVGLFNDALFPLWGQDDDWCNRLNYSGLKAGIVTGAMAVHDRAQRKETLEVLVKRNYYTGSLVRLADPGRALPLQVVFVLLFTLVKSLKYRSLMPFSYLKAIFRQMPAVREARRRAKNS